MNKNILIDYFEYLIDYIALELFPGIGKNTLKKMMELNKPRRGELVFNQNILLKTELQNFFLHGSYHKQIWIESNQYLINPSLNMIFH